MSAPKLTAKLRTKNNIPFTIEKISGLQFRCGVCGNIFYDRKELDLHLKREKPADVKKLKIPEFNQNISLTAIYTQDIRDLTNPKYPKLKKGDKLLKIQ